MTSVRSHARIDHGSRHVEGADAVLADERRGVQASGQGERSDREGVVGGIPDDA